MKLSSALTAIVLASEACSAAQTAPANCLSFLNDSNKKPSTTAEMLRAYKWEKDPTCDREVAGILATTAYNVSAADSIQCEKTGAIACPNEVSETTWSELIPPGMPSDLVAATKSDANQALSKRLLEFRKGEKYYKAKQEKAK